MKGLTPRGRLRRGEINRVAHSSSLGGGRREEISPSPRLTKGTTPNSNTRTASPSIDKMQGLAWHAIRGALRASKGLAPLDGQTVREKGSREGLKVSDQVQPLKKVAGTVVTIYTCAGARATEAGGMGFVVHETEPLAMKTRHKRLSNAHRREAYFQGGVAGSPTNNSPLGKEVPGGESRFIPYYKLATCPRPRRRGCLGEKHAVDGRPPRWGQKLSKGLAH